MLQYDCLYSATTCIENAAVLLDGGLISYDWTMSAQNLHVELTLNLQVWIMLPEEGWIVCDCTMGMWQLHVESTLML
jgi:hypothetical protein